MGEEPTSLLPLPGCVCTVVADALVGDAGHERAEPLEVDWFEDPRVEAGIDVFHPLSLEQRGRHGTDGYATVPLGAKGRGPCLVLRAERFLLGTDHLGGGKTIHYGHLRCWSVWCHQKRRTVPTWISIKTTSWYVSSAP